MPQFIKRPIPIEAVQFLGEDLPGVEHTLAGHPFLTTIHNNQFCLLELGDWIVPEPDGEHYYPIKDEIFRKIYEPLDAWRADSQYASTERITQLRHDAQEILKYEGELKQLLVSQQEFCPAMFTRQARDLAKAFLNEHPEN